MIIKVTSATPTMFVNTFECEGCRLDLEGRILHLLDRNLDSIACFNLDNVLCWEKWEDLPYLMREDEISNDL